MKINRLDVIWNYCATFLKIGSSVVILPIVLTKIESGDVGLWILFSTLTSIIFLLDFGFHNSFSRSVSFIFSGVDSLTTEGFSEQEIDGNKEINYSLLRALISSMKWLYSRLALFLFLLFITVGTFYIHHILEDYEGVKKQAYIAWFIFCFISSYNLYTLYFEALLEGSGKIRVTKKITVLGQLLFLVSTIILIYLRLGILALVISQFFSIVFIRFFSSKYFYTEELYRNLKSAEIIPFKNVLKIVSPNAIKYGVTSLGGFLIQKSSVFLGSIYLSLSAVATFGVTKQVLDLVINVSTIALLTYIPKISNLRIQKKKQEIAVIYLRGVLIANLLFICACLIIYFFGNVVLNHMESRTLFAADNILFVMIISGLIALNTGMSSAVIATKNEIPFMIPSLLSGILTVTLLFLGLHYSNDRMLVMAIVPGIVDLIYQGWKWPYEVLKDLPIRELIFAKRFKGRD